MTRVATRSELTPEEYLAWEREQLDKHEYLDSKMFAMSGGSLRHNALSLNVAFELKQRLGGTRVVLSPDQRVSLAEGRRYVYPDATVVCGPRVVRVGTKDTLVNPTILVEVLSSSTEQYDRGLEWHDYQQLASLTDYLLVSQRDVRVEHYARTGPSTWAYREHGAGEYVVLTGGATLAVDDIYAGTLELPTD
jgi:Uma2 family endonuclease